MNKEIAQLKTYRHIETYYDSIIWQDYTIKI